MKLEQKIAKELNQLAENYDTRKYLLAVSGGIDSMVLLNCFKALELTFEVAHFNFQLRGEESDRDQLLVETWCKNNNVAIHINTADTNAYTKEHGLSTQEAARQLRYNWFYQLTETHSFDWIITAHHANDTIETFFINLLRGAGIKGLTGIPKTNNKVLRPMLSVSREEIVEYITTHNIPFRKDSSNDSLKYKRNSIRHQLIPTLNRIDSQAEKAILKSMEHLASTEEYLKLKIQEDVLRYTETKASGIHIKRETPQLLLFEMLAPYGFNSAQVEDIQHAVIGGQFFSSSHQLLVDRTELILSPISEKLDHLVYINEPTNISTPIRLEMKELNSPLPFSNNKLQTQIDLDQLKFPLTLRKWKEGDWFIPLGMKGKKKLSDYFIDERISRVEKDNIWLLTSDENIVWIVGHRMDDRYKITDETKKVLNVVTFCLD